MLQMIKKIKGKEKIMFKMINKTMKGKVLMVLDFLWHIFFPILGWSVTWPRFTVSMALWCDFLLILQNKRLVNSDVANHYTISEIRAAEWLHMKGTQDVIMPASTFLNLSIITFLIIVSLIWQSGSKEWLEI